MAILFSLSERGKIIGKKYHYHSEEIWRLLALLNRGNDVQVSGISAHLVCPCLSAIEILFLLLYTSVKFMDGGSSMKGLQPHQVMRSCTSIRCP